MTDDHPLLVDADCPNCDDGLATITWPPDNPDAIDMDCFFCGVDVTVHRDGSIERRA